MKLYLGEWRGDDDCCPSYQTVGIYSSEEKAEQAVSKELDKSTWYYGRPVVVVSEWELDHVD